MINRIISIYKNVHFQSLFGNGLMAGIGMITLALLYRSLSLSDIGVYIFVLTVNGFLDTFRGGFLTITFIKFHSGVDPERARGVAGSSWLLGIVITVLAICINVPTFFIANFYTDPSLVLSLKYLSIIPIVTLPSFMANCVVQADKRFDRLLLLRLLSQGTFMIAIIVLMFLHKTSLTSVLLAFVATNIFSSLCVLSLGWAEILSMKYATRAIFWELFHYGKYAMGTNISSSLFGITNTFAINFLIGPAALAVYNLGGKLIQIVEIPLLSFAATGMPILSTHYNKGEKMEMIKTLEKLVGMLTVILVPFVLLVLIFAEPIIQLVGGKAYTFTEAPNLLRIFIVMSLLYPADRYFALAVDVIHKPKVNFYKILIMLTVNILGVIIGIAVYHSVYAVAVALLFPTIIAIVITYYPLNSYSSLNFLKIYSIGFKEIFSQMKKFKKSLI